MEGRLVPRAVLIPSQSRQVHRRPSRIFGAKYKEIPDDPQGDLEGPEALDRVVFDSIDIRTKNPRWVMRVRPQRQIHSTALCPAT